MTINDLQAYLLVYERRHISNAAIDLHMSQSELSKRMRALENELNIQLIDTHNKRRLQITPAGETFYHHVLKLMTDYTAMMRDLALNRPTTLTKLTIGSIPISGQYQLAQKIAAFKPTHPELALTLIEDEGNRVLERLLTGECQAAIIRDTQTNALQPTDFQKQSLLSDDLKVILPVDHPLAQQSVIQIQDLAQQSLVSLPAGSGVYELIMALFAKQNMTPKFAFESTHIESLLATLTNSHNVTLLFERAVAPFMTDQFVMRSLPMPVTSHLQFVYPQRTSNQLLAELATFLRGDDL